MPFMGRDYVMSLKVGKPTCHMPLLFMSLLKIENCPSPPDIQSCLGIPFIVMKPLGAMGMGRGYFPKIATLSQKLESKRETRILTFIGVTGLKFAKTTLTERELEDQYMKRKGDNFFFKNRWLCHV